MGTSHDSYVLCTNDTPVDRWLKAYYDKTGFKGVMLNANYNLENDIALVGDYVIFVFMDPKMIEELDKMYSTPHDMTEAISAGILETILSKRTKIKVTIVKNRALARHYREKILGYFSEKEQKPAK
ncbi:MAG: hypothetical protein AABW59_00915 [archaeon]